MKRVVQGDLSCRPGSYAARKLTRCPGGRPLRGIAVSNTEVLDHRVDGIATSNGEAWIAAGTRYPFAANPLLARQMLTRVQAAGIPFACVVGDTVHRHSSNLRIWLEDQGLQYVLAVPRYEILWPGPAARDSGGMTGRAGSRPNRRTPTGAVTCTSGIPAPTRATGRRKSCSLPKAVT